jgi:hypothetical protein
VWLLCCCGRKTMPHGECITQHTDITQQHISFITLMQKNGWRYVAAGKLR